MPIGTGQRRPRNKASRLPREARRIVASLLMDGEGYEAVREALTAAGVAAAALPGDSAFAAYMASAEFRDAEADYREFLAGAERRSIAGAALEDADVEESARLLTYRALARLERALRDEEEGADPAEIGRLAVAVAKVAGESQRARMQAIIGDLEAELAAAQSQPGQALSAANTLPAKQLEKIKKLYGLA